MALFQELRRRKMFRVAAVYAITAWLLIQIAATVEAPLNLPDWVDTLVIVLLAIGFPLALALAWSLGTHQADADEEELPSEAAILPPGRSKLDYAIIGLVVVAIGWLLYRTEVAPLSQAPGLTAEQELPAVSEPVVAVETVPKVLQNSIAVLPFENMSPDPDDEYFASGIHEELLNQLAKIKDLSVLARTTMTRYADSELSVPEIGRELNVGAVMEGSVRYAGERVRITAQLIDVETGAHLWSEAYDRDLTDIFAVQSDIALNITEAMKVEFSLAEQKSIAKTLTSSPEAYAHYVKALSRLTEPIPDLEAIQSDLEQAISHDPEFASALALRAYFFAAATALIREDVPLTPENQTANAGQATLYAEKALAIDADQAGAYLARSYVDFIGRDWASSFDNAERAYRLNPNQTQVIWDYGARLCYVGQFDECIALFDRAISLNPHDINLPLFSGVQATFARRWEDANRYLGQVITLAPDFYVPYVLLAASAAWTGDQELARRMAKECEARLGGSNVPNTFVWLLMVYNRLGDDDDVMRIGAKLEEIDKVRPLDDTEWAIVRAIEGDMDQAFEHLNAAIEKNFPAVSVVGLAVAPNAPQWDRLRDDPRFKGARARLNPPN